MIGLTQPVFRDLGWLSLRSYYAVNQVFLCYVAVILLILFGYGSWLDRLGYAVYGCLLAVSQFYWKKDPNPPKKSERIIHQAHIIANFYWDQDTAILPVCWFQGESFSLSYLPSPQSTHLGTFLWLVQMI